MMRVIHDGPYPEMQLREEIIGLCRRYLWENHEIWDRIRTKDEWLEFRAEKLKVYKSFFPDFLFEKRKLNVRKVSEYKFDGFRIENVIFESMPGWEVNGTVYLPENEGVYPGVVCPTGHSSKTYPNYQRSAQVFARNGYIAVSFDPPGSIGELSYMNDHFTNGLIGYLTGIWSQTHFIIDALAALDYLETREDVDKDLGFAMTGVSGGGQTTLECAILDDRIKFFAPVCCLTTHEKCAFQDLYTGCPETYAIRQLKEGLTNAEYLSIAAPKPCLIVAGKGDEVLDYREATKVYQRAKRFYGLMGDENLIDMFIDEESGHAYTVKMANIVVERMNRYIRKKDTGAEQLTEEDIIYVDADKLLCRPSNKVNMYTVNRDEAAKLENKRHMPETAEEKRDYIRSKAIQILGIENEYNGVLANAKTENGKVNWQHRMQKLELFVNQDIRVPALLLKRENHQGRVPALLFADEKGKWEGFRQDGFLTRSARFPEREHADREPLVLSIDVSGTGELTPEPSYYDLTFWNDIERVLTYLSISAAKPIMGRRVRDIIAAIEYLQKRDDVDENRIMLGGRGIGAIAAMHAALIWGKAYRLICLNMLSHYGSMAEKFPFACRQSIIIPEILKYYDLPDIAEVVPAGRLVLINPLDCAGNLIDADEASKLYGKAIKKGAQVYCGLSEKDASDKLVGSVLGNSR